MHKDHYRRFDLLRGGAAIVVLLTHVVLIFLARLSGHDTPLVHLSEILARHAVLVFFLLSGYLITDSMLANIRRNGAFSPLQYLTSRITRIYPALCGAMLITLIAWVVIHGLGLPGTVLYGLSTDRYAEAPAFVISGTDFIRALLMQGEFAVADAPLWSLYAEFHIYLIAMFVALAWRARGGVRLAWMGVAGSLLGLWAYAWAPLIFYALVWTLGAAVALADRGTREVSRARGLRTAALAAAIALVVWFILAPNYDSFVVDRTPMWLGFAVQGLCSVCYAWLVFRARSLSRAVPQWLISTGGFSYSLYVIHYPLLLLGLSLTQNWMGASALRAWLVAAASIPVTLWLAMRFARYFEDQRRFSGTVRAALTAVRSELLAYAGVTE